MDLLRHFKTQWIPLRNKETAQGRSFEKVLILKQAHFLGSQCPDLISGGNLFGAIPATVPFIIQQGCVLICHWTTEDLFRITMQCFESPGHNGIGFPTVHVSLLTIQCLQPVHGQQDTFAEQKMHPSTQQNSV
ncbi:hypothetical protein TNCT_379981 [Trichonephila clavata]|uniref:Uncharacterized protein n=1 Tax=Trichonephila clavata TaxID=2740835 RepID=A0A8X6HPF9_TRICU|nr:hypothetical protein TNCT_379981 [Trichonephila clavata]